MKQSGVIHFIPLVILAFLAAGVIYLSKDTKPPVQINAVRISEIKQSPVPTTASVATPSPALTSTPSSAVAPVPSPTEKPAAPAVSGPPGAGFSSVNVATEKGNFQASVLAIDLNNARMITDTADDSDCANECKTLSLKDLVERNGGFAGVNGSYFCPDTYPDCSSKKNSFDFPVYNTRLNKWINQGNLFWNDRSVVYLDGSGVHYLQNAKDFNGELSAGITNYPGILESGNVQIDENQSGLSDKQKAKGTKVGIGVRDNKNIMIAIVQNVTMYEFAHVFKSLGAKGVLNLDTGGSTALYYNGSYIAGPGRNLPNAIIFAK